MSGIEELSSTASGGWDDANSMASQPTGGQYDFVAGVSQDVCEMQSVVLHVVDDENRCHVAGAPLDTRIPPAPSQWFWLNVLESLKLVGSLGVSMRSLRRKLRWSDDVAAT